MKCMADRKCVAVEHRYVSTPHFDLCRRDRFLSFNLFVIDDPITGFYHNYDEKSTQYLSTSIDPSSKWI